MARLSSPWSLAPQKSSYTAEQLRKLALVQKGGASQDPYRGAGLATTQVGKMSVPITGTPSGTTSVFSNYMNRMAPTATGPSQATQIGGIQSQAILEQQRRAEELRNMILGPGAPPATTPSPGGRPQQDPRGLIAGPTGPGAQPQPGTPGMAGGWRTSGDAVNFARASGRSPSSQEELNQWLLKTKGTSIWGGGTTPQTPTYPGTPGGLLEQQLIGKTLQPGIGQGTIQGMKTQASDLIAEQQRQAAGQQVGAYGGAGSYGGRLRSGLGEIERGGELARQKGMTDIDVQTAIYNDKASMDALGQLQTYVNSLTQKEQYGQQLSLQERQLLEQIKQSGIGNMMQLYQSQQTPDWLSLLEPGGVPQDALSELLKATYY